MKKLVARLCLFFAPVLAYFALFAAFEPYNYFGLRSGAADTNQPIYRVRSFLQQPQDAILLGDSRMAHLDMQLVEQLTGRKFSNLAFGGASEKEMIDLFWFAVEENPRIDTVYLEVSFYTLNRYYDKDRTANIRTVAENPLAYLFNMGYNLEMLANLKNTLLGAAPAVGETETATYTEADYLDESGAPLPYRRQLIDYAATIYGVVTSGAEVPAGPAQAAAYMADPAGAALRRWAVNEEQLARLLQVAEYCADNGIRLVFVLPPVDESIRQLVLRPLGIERDFAPVVQQLRATGATVLDYELGGCEVLQEHQFFDGFHIDTVYGLPAYTRLLFANGAA